jgi:undecaprenyl-diphosphatase
MKLTDKELRHLGLISLLLFLFFTFLVYLNLFSTLDYKTTVFVQELIPSIFITPFSTFSILGTAEFTGIILLILLFLFVKYKKIYILALFILVGLIEIAGKTFIHQAGPPLYFLKTNLSLGLPIGGVAHNFFAYPSGHSARTAFISGFLLILVWLSPKLSREMKIIIGIGILAFDLIMFVSRVYLGEHWTSDVVGGLLLGFSLAFLTTYFLNIKSLK